MRRFGTGLTVDDCVARGRQALAGFDRFGVPLTKEAIIGDLAGGRIDQAGFVVQVSGKPRGRGLFRQSVLTIRGHFLPSATGTVIEVDTRVGRVGALVNVAMAAAVLPIVLNVILFNAGIANSPWSFVWRIAIVALSAIPGGLLIWRMWREDIRWVTARDVAGHWVVRTFSAIERPPSDDGAGEQP
jgi:hypothetical protein